MNTREITEEQISAFADGELADAHLASTLAALARADGAAAWEAYHRVGDVLRSDEMAMPLSADFTSRLMARLDAEPSIVASPVRHQQDIQVPAAAGRMTALVRSMKYAAKPGLAAAAAVATIALVASPQMMVATKDLPSRDNEMAMVASGSPIVVPVALESGKSQAPVILRDPRIDEYLLAHQRFSPSLYSTAQYARSATFATDSDK